MKVIDYSNTIMYKLVPNDLNLDLIYIGSTTNFRTRKGLHKYRCNNSNDKRYYSKVYSMIRENGGWSEWSMIEIEKYPCADSNECRKRERELMEQYNCNLNTYKSYTSPEEVLQYQSNYKATHKNETREYNAKYRLDNKNIIQAKAKEYYIANQDKIKKKQKQNYDANKDIILTKRREKRLQQKLSSLNLEN